MCVLDDLSSGQLSNIDHLHPRADFSTVIDSITNDDVVADLVDEADVVFHLAAAVGVRMVVSAPLHTVETNVTGTQTVLRHACRGGTLVVLASTSEVYGKGTALPFREDADLVLGAPDQTEMGIRSEQAPRRVPGVGVREGTGSTGHHRSAVQHGWPSSEPSIRHGAPDVRQTGARG